MPEGIQQFLVAKIVPTVAAAITTWLFATSHVFNLFGVNEGQVVAVVVQALTFGVTYALAWLTTHHILKGHYTPAAKANTSV